jgi:hypothetical protein
MRQFFSEHGTKEKIIRTNPVATQKWLGVLSTVDIFGTVCQARHTMLTLPN